MLEKVTAFVTQGDKLLLFHHPSALVQFPAGTVDMGELPENAVVREVYEETGLTDVTIQRYLGHKTEHFVDRLMVTAVTKVYARPDATSFDWATMRRGIRVNKLREQGDFIQIEYREVDDLADPQYVTYQITGWVPRETVSDSQTRHFYHLICHEETPDSWTIHADNHHFALFWAPLAQLPAVSPYQQTWLKIFLANQGKY